MVNGTRPLKDSPVFGIRLETLRVVVVAHVLSAVQIVGVLAVRLLARS
jgi:hypothetical protein